MTDTAQALELAGKHFQRTFSNYEIQLRECIRSLVADIEQEQEGEIAELRAQLAQAREALSEAIEIISSGLESEGDLEAGWSKSDRKWLRKARAALAQGEKR